MITIEPTKKLAIEAATAKVERVAALGSLTITTASGKVFDADLNARSAMTTAVLLGADGQTTPWKMADNTVVDVEWTEMKEALYLTGIAQTTLIAVV